MTYQQLSTVQSLWVKMSVCDSLCRGCCCKSFPGRILQVLKKANGIPRLSNVDVALLAIYKCNQASLAYQSQAVKTRKAIINLHRLMTLQSGAMNFHTMVESTSELKSRLPFRKSISLPVVSYPFWYYWKQPVFRDRSSFQSWVSADQSQWATENWKQWISSSSRQGSGGKRAVPESSVAKLLGTSICCFVPSSKQRKKKGKKKKLLSGKKEKKSSKLDFRKRLLLTKNMGKKWKGGEGRRKQNILLQSPNLISIPKGDRKSQREQERTITSEIGHQNINL